MGDAQRSARPEPRLSKDAWPTPAPFGQVTLLLSHQRARFLRIAMPPTPPGDVPGTRLVKQVVVCRANITEGTSAIDMVENKASHVQEAVSDPHQSSAPAPTSNTLSASRFELGKWLVRGIQDAAHSESHPKGWGSGTRWASGSATSTLSAGRFQLGSWLVGGLSARGVPSVPRDAPRESAESALSVQPA